MTLSLSRKAAVLRPQTITKGGGEKKRSPDDFQLNLCHNIWCGFYNACIMVNPGRYANIRGIHAVRQGCVFNARLFCGVLEIAMSVRCAQMETQGLNLHDGMKVLLDLRFADELLVFASSHDDAIRLLEELVTALGQVGLTLHTSKTTILSTQTELGRPDNLQARLGRT